MLNIDKENLKIAALQGTIKLENVMLDGDLLGQTILGAVGLSGFGILSCCAKSVRISIPFTNIEKEPTRFEMRGVHLVCLPLLPSTAHKMYGAGTAVDPRCTLRTRAKRSKLARYERNFLSGRIPGEGPPAKRILRAVKEVEREMQRKRHRRRGSFSKVEDGDDDDNTLLDSLVSDDIETVNADNSIYGGTETSSATFSVTSDDKSSKDPLNSADLPELPRDWKVKLREKLMRNMEASLHDIHVRCEVSERGLDFCHPDHRPKHLRRKQDSSGSESGFGTIDGDSEEQRKPDQRAFAFGLTLDSFIVRTANEKWEVGSHEKSSETSVKDHLGPNPYDARNNKLITFDNFGMYWDDDPPFLISETPIVTMSSEEHKLSAEKVQTRITAAMEALSRQQEPGTKIRESMMGNGVRNRSSEPIMDERGHQYCFEGFNCQIRQKLSNRMEPGPISCLAEILPFHWDVKFRPHQVIQYQKLKSAMLSQKRFDTMLRQRPNQNPLQNPRGWWKYAIGCVTSRPTSRPWHDVLKISKNRNRYLQLVVKKLSKSSEASGFHSGLSAAESSELLVLEDLLPIEALLAFHLIALRKFAQSSGVNPNSSDKKSKDDSKDINRNDKSPIRPGRVIGRSKLTRIFRKSKSAGPDFASNSAPSSSFNKPPVPSMVTTPTNPVSPVSLLEAMTIRLGRKPWYTDFKLDHGSLHVTLLSSTDASIVSLRSEMTGSARSYGGQGKVDYFFDITLFEIMAESQAARGPGGDGKVLVVQATDEDSQYFMDDQATIGDILDSTSCEFDVQAVTDFMDLPPPGVVCRIAASRDPASTKLSFSAHPATLVWTRPCFDAVAEFFGAPSTEMQTELTIHLKNAATPLARKAQLALLSPTVLQLHVNVAAPKIWVPFTSKGTDGALFLDAGNLRMACSKVDGETHTSWKVDATDIQVNFARWSLSLFKDRVMTPIPMSASIEMPNSGVTSIIRPFHVWVVAGVQEWPCGADVVGDNINSYDGPVNCVDVTISPICLNLVDAEVLARAIGKWYAQGLLRVRGGDSSKPKTNNSDLSSAKDAEQGSSSNAKVVEETLTRSDANDVISSIKMPNGIQSLMPNSISVSVKKIEMALEGHSKVAFSDEKSVESHDYSLLEHAPSIRTYVVEAFDIGVRQFKYGLMTTTKFIVGDASIVQLKDASAYNPMKDRHQASEAQYSILERGSRQISPEDCLWTPRAHFNAGQSPASMTRNANVRPPKHENHGRSPHTDVFSATLFHDGTIHLDEVEIDVDSIILRVTPTSLKDCVKAIRKIIELVQLMTREMERKVHEEGRKARRRGRESKFQYSHILLSITHNAPLTMFFLISYGSDRWRRNSD